MKKILLLSILLFICHISFCQTIDNFSDGDFISNPTWGGSTSSWTITNSDASTGSTSSNTLRLNAPAVSQTDYLSLQKPNPTTWGTSQTWAFWIGRRAQAATAANSSIVWIYANESDLTSNTVDGYRITFGDNSGGDEIVLEKVTDGVGTAIITSSGSIPNGTTDYGFQVRVTRSSSSLFTLYTSTLPLSNGTGALATDVLDASTTSVNQGSIVDATYTNFDNGYLGFAATHSTGAPAIVAQEFDNYKFDTSDVATLPISLTSFTGKAIDKNILLSWNTASEENNDYFDIQHSADGKTFSSIGKINGAGNSKVSKDYSFVDENPYAGTSYYKLVQHDFDGKTSDSKVVAVNSNIAAATLSVYAASSAVKITLSSPNKTEGTFEVFDISGRKLASQAVEVSKGYNQLSVLLGLQPGVHFVKYTADGKTITQKFMK